MLRVPVHRIERGMILARPVALPSDPHRYLLQRDMEIPMDIVPRLKDMGVLEVWVRHRDLEFLEDIIDEGLGDQQREVYQHVRQNFESIMSGAAMELDIAQFTSSISGLFGYLKGSTGSNMLLQKWSPDGQLLWSRRWGTSGSCAGLVVSANAVYIYGDCLRNGDDDLVLLRFDLDGNLVWQRFRDFSDDDQAVQLRPIYSLAGVNGLIAMADCKINGEYSIVKTEFDLNGDATSCKQLGSSSQTKRHGHVIYQPGISPDSTYYYVAGEIETVDGMRVFVSQTDGTGANVWSWRWDVAAYVNDFALGNEFNMVLSGASTDLPSAGFQMSLDKDDGEVHGQRFLYAGDPVSREFNANEDAAGMLYCGHSREANTGSFSALPSATALNLQFQDVSANGGDPSYFIDPAAGGTVTSVTALGILDDGAGNTDAELWHYSTW